MHIIIGVITAIAGFMWALHSLQNAGVDLNAFNPFTWARRRKWEKQLGTKPMHALTDSMDAAALLIMSVAKEDGDITRDSKMEILSMFESEFGLPRNKAIEVFSASTYMLKDVVDMSLEVKSVLAPCKNEFQRSHIVKLIEMLNKVSNFEASASQGQLKIIKAVETELETNEPKPSKW